jgi:hypothetical protein
MKGVFPRSVAALLGAAAVAACADTPTPTPTELKPTAELSREGTRIAHAEVIATGLNNPRQLAIGPRGSLYVTEAGLGAGSPEAGVVAGLGFTGSVTRIDRPASARPDQQRILTGLASAASIQDGNLQVVGADGIGFDNRAANAPMYVSFGAHGGPGLGLFVRYADDGTSTVLGDVGGTDFAWTGLHPELGEDLPDADPYGLLALPRHRYVVDAGANTLDEVGPDGQVRILAFFPSYASLGGVSDAVPTCVARGPDGALYIGTLALAELFAKGPGQALVYRLDPDLADPNDFNKVLNIAQVWARDFDSISSCTFAPNGDFLATEMFANGTGDVVRVPFRHPDQKLRFGQGEVTLPTGIAVGGGAIYVSNVGTSTTAGTGQVLRFRD